MKTMFFLVSLLVSSAAFAHNVEFAADSALPAEMQGLVAKAIAASCPAESRLPSHETKTVADRVNTAPGVYETRYSTSLTMMGSDQDGYHPRALPIMVESAVKSGGTFAVRLVYGCGPATNYQCVSSRLQAMNSDVFYQLSPADIHALLMNSSERGHAAAVEAAIQCRH